MNQKTPNLARLEPFSDLEMRLGWGEAGEYAVPYVEIRFHCPCAVCVDEHTGKRVLRREEVRADVKPAGAQRVGRYAIQIQWNDGHATGIYPDDRLFELSSKFGRKL